LINFKPFGFALVVEFVGKPDGGSVDGVGEGAGADDGLAPVITVVLPCSDDKLHVLPSDPMLAAVNWETFRLCAQI